jgi:uncharacterized protein
MTALGGSSLVPQYGLGLGLRPKHYADISEGRSSVDHISWFEVVSDNYVCSGGRSLHFLEEIRRDFPIACHGIAMNLGSVDPLDEKYLSNLKEFADRVDPFVVSDHCCWNSNGGQYLHDLLPLPYTQESLKHLADRITRVQERLGRRILLENVSSYLQYEHSEMTEWEFLSEVCRKADCGLLLDVNNIYVSSVNHKFDPLLFLDGVPLDRVGQMHMAGHTRYKSKSGDVYLIDTHSKPVCPEVWDLYGEAVRRLGPVNTMIEWDSDIPEWSVLHAEILKAKVIQEKVVERSA